MGRKRTSIAGIDKSAFQEWEGRFTTVKQRERLTVLRMAATGAYTLEMISQAVGRAVASIQTWLGKFASGGIDSLMEVKTSPGRPVQVPQAVREEIVEHLTMGSWRTAGQMRQWLKSAHDIELKIGASYYLLGKCGGRLKLPRPCHHKQDPLAREAFKESGWDQALAQLPIPKGEKVEFWVMDESRFGLHTIVKRVWGQRGVRVVKAFQQKFDWEYVYGALNVINGQVVQCFMPTVSKEVTWDFLREVVKTAPESHHVVLWDGAGFHQPVPKEDPLMEELCRVHVVKLPPYCPELNPTEKYWDQLKDSVCNRTFATINELRAGLEPTMQEFWECANKVKSIIGDNWLSRKTNNGYRLNLPVFN